MNSTIILLLSIAVFCVFVMWAVLHVKSQGGEDLSFLEDEQSEVKGVKPSIEIDNTKSLIKKFANDINAFREEQAMKKVGFSENMTESEIVDILVQKLAILEMQRAESAFDDFHDAVTTEEKIKVLVNKISEIEKA